MFAIVPLLCFVFMALAFSLKSQDQAGRPCWRSAFLSAALAWGLLLTAMTEFLSALNLITFGWLLGLWGFATLISALICLTLIHRARLSVHVGILKVPPFEAVLLLAVAFIVISVGLIALVAPPNTWDSMTYHMSRVVHWIQNRNVAVYPTHIFRQVEMNPWAEFAILHAQVLSGGDRFANGIQWFSMLGSTIGVTLLAKELGAGPRGQVLAAVASATIPMGILQASSTQNDYAVSFWLVCFALSVMRLKGSPNLTHAIAAGSSLGLAILTKATAYVYAAPFLAWSCVSGLRTSRWKYLKSALVIAIVVVSVNHGHYRRLLDMHGSPFGPGQKNSSGEYTYTNDLFTIPAVASNMVRNLALQAASPSERFNRLIERGVRLFHAVVGMDINDPRTTLAGSEFRVARLSTHEDFAANPLHLSLAAVATALLLTGRGLRRQRHAVIYLTVVICAFLLFSLFLRWQPWQNRLQLPIFVLFSPLIAITLSGIPSQTIAKSVGLALVLCSLPWVFHNVSRPLVGQTSIFTASRTDQYFTNRPDLKDPYQSAARYVRSRGCQDIGLILGRDDWEYPLWVLLRNTGNRVVRLEHIGVKNLSAVKSKVLRKIDPCAVISLQAGLIDVFFRR